MKTFQVRRQNLRQGPGQKNAGLPGNSSPGHRHLGRPVRASWPCSPVSGPVTASVGVTGTPSPEAGSARSRTPTAALTLCQAAPPLPSQELPGGLRHGPGNSAREFHPKSAPTPPGLESTPRGPGRTDDVQLLRVHQPQHLHIPGGTLLADAGPVRAVQRSLVYLLAQVHVVPGKGGRQPRPTRQSSSPRGSQERPRRLWQVRLVGKSVRLQTEESWVRL